MADDMVKEQVYTIPLRKVKNVPSWKRANRAVTEVRGFLVRHMKLILCRSKWTNQLMSASGKKAVKSLLFPSGSEL